MFFFFFTNDEINCLVDRLKWWNVLGRHRRARKTKWNYHIEPKADVVCFGRILTFNTGRLNWIAVFCHRHRCIYHSFTEKSSQGHKNKLRFNIFSVFLICGYFMLKRLLQIDENFHWKLNLYELNQYMLVWSTHMLILRTVLLSSYTTVYLWNSFQIEYFILFDLLYWLSGVRFLRFFLDTADVKCDVHFYLCIHFLLYCLCNCDSDLLMWYYVLL